MFWPGHIFGFLRVPILHNSSAEVLDLSKKADLQKSTVRSQLGWIRINIWRNGSMERDKSKKKYSWISWIGWIHLLMTIEHNLRYRWRFCNYPHMVPGWVLDCIHIYIYILLDIFNIKNQNYLVDWVPPHISCLFFVGACYPLFWADVLEELPGSWPGPLQLRALAIHGLHPAPRPLGTSGVSRSGPSVRRGSGTSGGHSHLVKKRE